MMRNTGASVGIAWMTYADRPAADSSVAPGGTLLGLLKACD